MISGDSFRRNSTLPVPDPPKSLWTAADKSQDALSQKAVGFNCLDYQGVANGPEPSLFRHFMPSKQYLDAYCPDGLRLELMFPSCWNGLDVDAPDHKSHVAYSDLVMDGTCPPEYGVRIPSLYFEVVWNTTQFRGDNGLFVLANGDPTGHGYHGDFMSGWNFTILQAAVSPGPSQCNNNSGLIQDCPLFSLADETCTFPQPTSLQSEDYTGPRLYLPGCLNITDGPEPQSP